MPLKQIHETWAKNKMTAEAAKSEILASKAVGAEKMIRVLEFHTMEQNKIMLERQAKATIRLLQSKEYKFRRHPVIDEWVTQFTEVHSKPSHRYTSLLLRGESKAGKTAIAVSLFGSAATLVVNCQGCAPDLPSIQHFDREKHSAIVWDEIDETQVLNNKLVFQAGAHLITLGQSKCNQYSYGMFLHGVAMIMCSNTFVMPGQDRVTNLASVDADWLVKNVREVSLPPGEVWYVKPVENVMDQAG